ncbi:52 kDa repressor of the inhibitor of the protein kinase-like [Hydractinia symbiolongicarpus]|uniref:52 kDa repressor of the inhibitor of the protein kinase-like n=1 Tax=Hydractinia symbiolongicarpus TaxID=13093 RepID=UPI00254DE809|nr:52 kDa repressor of the inhibitor of the protein kinase-like [Hydractinia symbiolongicarpus]
MAAESMFELVRLALQKNDLCYIQDIYLKYCNKIRKLPSFSNEDILNSINNNNILRNFNAEVYLPKILRKDLNKCAVALCSESTGNCLYSSASILLVGDNSLVEDLRILTSLELFLCSEYYSRHPVLLSLFEEHKGKVFKSVDSILRMVTSFDALDASGSSCSNKLVKNEAIGNCKNQKWCSLLCIFALSSVSLANINTYFPDCGDSRDKILFNCIISPRNPTPSLRTLKFLFCLQSFNVDSSITFKPNHFVPIIFVPNGTKRKLPHITKKEKMSCVPTKKISVQSKLSFWTDKCSDTLIFPKVMPLINVHKPVVSNPLTITPSLDSNSLIFESSHTICHPPVQSHVATTSIVTQQISQSTVISEACAVTKMPFPTPSPCSNMPDSLLPVNRFDVSLYREKMRTLKNDTSAIQDLIKNVFKPNNNYVFPKTKRCFRFEWLNKFPWLCYSPAVDGAYCLPCVLFGEKFPTKTNKIKKLFSESFRYWPDANAHFLKHNSSTGLHADTSAVFTSFISNYFGKSQPIDILVDSNRRKKIAENRKKLVPIVQAIIYSGRQGQALRGHRDDSQYHGEVGEFSCGRVGNFVELLNFRVQGGDTILAEHLKNSPKNATYISKTTQNELISCCGEFILDKLVSEIKNNVFYSILADEASDSSHKEQMSLVLRFVDDSFNIREEFIQFIHCDEGLSGKDLQSVLCKCLEHLKLNIKDCRGQAYDGAGAVAGYKNGLSARILSLNRKAIYVHCNSHRLNLSVGKSCTVSLVSHVMTKIKHITYFFKFSEKRHQALLDNIKKYCPLATVTKLTDVCRTRWVERITGLDTFQELYIAIYVTLEEMKLNLEMKYNHDTSKQAVGFFHQIANFEFVVTLVITRSIFDVTLHVTQLLQNKSIDIMDSIDLIKTLQNVLRQTRNNVDHFHDLWYKETLSLCAKVGIEEEKKRTVGRQINRDNHPFTCMSDFYKKAVTNPLLDHLNSEMKSRFEPIALSVYNGLCIVPAKMINLLSNGKVNWKEKFTSFSSFYEDDLPNALALSGELELWERYWVDFKGTRPETIAQTLKSIDLKVFVNLNVALRILATIPVTTCECERSFSSMRKLKSYTRTTMVSDRLNGLALMYIHNEIVPDVHQVINKFAKDKRRLELI